MSGAGHGQHQTQHAVLTRRHTGAQRAQAGDGGGGEPGGERGPGGGGEEGRPVGVRLEQLVAETVHDEQADAVGGGELEGVRLGHAQRREQRPGQLGQRRGAVAGNQWRVSIHGAPFRSSKLDHVTAKPGRPRQTPKADLVVRHCQVGAIHRTWLRASRNTPAEPAHGWATLRAYSWPSSSFDRLGAIHTVRDRSLGISGWSGAPTRGRMGTVDTVDAVDAATP